MKRLVLTATVAAVVIASFAAVAATVRLPPVGKLNISPARDVQPNITTCTDPDTDYSAKCVKAAGQVGCADPSAGSAMCIGGACVFARKAGCACFDGEMRACNTGMEGNCAIGVQFCSANGGTYAFSGPCHTQVGCPPATPPKGQGGTCSGDPDCVGGLVCTGGTCQHPTLLACHTQHQSCAFSADCCGPLSCAQGRCEPPQPPPPPKCDTTVVLVDGGPYDKRSFWGIREDQTYGPEYCGAGRQRRDCTATKTINSPPDHSHCEAHWVSSSNPTDCRCAAHFGAKSGAEMKCQVAVTSQAANCTP